MKKKIIGCLMMFFICFGAFSYFGGSTQKANAATISGVEGITGTWLWNTEIIKTRSDEIISFLKESGINEVYLQVNSDVSKRHYRNFIEKSSENGIEIYALDGAPNWILEENQYKVDEFFDWVNNYNNTSSSNQKFSGIHLDVEPYALPAWKEDKQNVVLLYQNYINYAKDKSSELGLSFGVDLPFWFDGVEFSNIHGEGNVAKWVLEKVDSVNIMAYRDKAGKIVSCAIDELQWAKELGKKLVISVHIGKSSEGDSVTFYEEGKDYMYAELETVREICIESGYTPNIAIHYLEKLMEFK